jgi:dihydroorotase-like cyclic amidohydrolase
MTQLDLVVRGDLVLPDRVLHHAALGVRDGRIAEVIDPARDAPDAAETIDAGDALVLPGLVDTHVHCETVSTDHAPWPLALKQRPMLAAAAGVAGLETSLALLHTEAARRGFPLPALIEAVAGRPADLFGLSGRKGRLIAGYDADFVIFDPVARWTFTAASSHSSARHSPYDGRELVGRVRASYVRGKAVYADGEVLADPGYGHWLARAANVPTPAA